MSISASWIVLAVLWFRFILKKAPKWLNVVLWGIVALRLIFPFSIESALSLIPSTETIPLNIEMSETPTIHSSISAINNAVNPMIGQSNTPAVGASVNPMQIVVAALAVVWIAGIAALLAYTAISYLYLRRRVDTAIPLRKGIYQSENVSSPFVFGILKPKIYLPFDMSVEDLNHVIAHEQAHIRRKDHLWKPLGFLLLTLHWFNPLMWLAYVLLCRDIELACDEKVIKELGNEQRADYSQALLSCSVKRRVIAACPLAFGEVGVKERVKSVMNYKKPAFWIVLASVIACSVLAVCMLTNPKDEQDLSFLNYNNLVSLAAQSDMLTVRVNSNKAEYDASIDGNELAAILDNAAWKEQRGLFRTIQRDTEKNSTSSVQIRISEDIFLTFFDTDTAYIYSKTQGDGRYYRTEESNYQEVLAKVKKTDTLFNHLSLEDAVYRSEKCIYMNPLSSYMPINGDSGCSYMIGENRFEIHGREEAVFDQVEWNYTPFTQSDWESWFGSSTISVPDIGGYDKKIYFDLDGKWRVLNMNGELWIMECKQNDRMGNFVWSIYSLIPAESAPTGKDITYTAEVSWVNYAEDASLYMGCLNRDKMTISSVRHLPIFKCESKVKLEQFRTSYSDVLDFSGSYDEIGSFDDACKGYDDDFFEDNALFLVYVTAGSGSFRFGVDRVYADGESAKVFVNQLNDPETHTDDMAGWLISVGVSKTAIKGCTVFDAALGDY